MRARTRFAVLAAAFLAAGCGGDSPRPGTLLVQLNSATPARAVRFRLSGPGMAVLEPSSGAVVVSQAAGGDTLLVAAFAPVGATLNGAAVAAVSVPDTRAAANYRATTLEAAGPSYALIPPAQVTLTVVPQ